MFDIEKWLSFNNTPTRIRGENVKKGNINICCPICIKSGRGDTNFHMGINPLNGYYGCWRNSTHRGRKIENIVRMLSNCSYEEAYRVVYGTVLVERPAGESMHDTINKKLLNKNKEDDVAPELKELLFPSEFINIKNTGVTKKFYDYLSSRGFDDVDKLIKKYSLFCCLNGEYSDRIIFPIFMNGELVTWSSRRIDSNTFLRYRDLEVDKSLIHVKQLLYNYDNIIEGGNNLFITEGLFDCIKLDYYFSNGNRATCFSTKSMTDNQMYQVMDLSKVFNKISILMDNDAKPASVGISRKLDMLPNVSFKFLPEGFKDPGEFTKEEILNLETEVQDGTSESREVYPKLGTRGL